MYVVQEAMKAFKGAKYISVSEWKYTIASAFKFKFLCQPEAASCSPANNGRGYSQMGGN